MWKQQFIRKLIPTVAHHENTKLRAYRLVLRDIMQHFVTWTPINVVNLRKRCYF